MSTFIPTLPREAFDVRHHEVTGSRARRDERFWDLHVRWSSEVRRWIRRLGGAEADVDDLMQEVFVVVHRRIDAFDGLNPGGWIYRITRNQVRDARRKIWVKRRCAEGLHESLVAPGLDPESELVLKREAGVVAGAFSTLSEGERRALWMFEVEGLSGEEISVYERTSLNTVWSRLRRARAKVRAIARRCESNSRDKPVRRWSDCRQLA